MSRLILFSLGITMMLSFKGDVKIDSKSPLFKIERSKDSNQIVYDVNTTLSGKLSDNNPINIYWIKNTKGGRLEPLTWIQKKYAYGLKFLSIEEEQATFQFVSYDKVNFAIKKFENDKYDVFTKFNDRFIKIQRIFIQIDGGTFWLPNITKIEVFAKDIKTNEDVVEVVTSY